MVTILYILHVLVCLALLPVILLQAGKGGGVNAAFGGGGSQSVFGGSSGASTFLIKLTTGAAITFMCTSLGLSYLSSRSKSVIGDVPVAEQPVAPAAGAGAAASPSGSPAAPAAGTSTLGN